MKLVVDTNVLISGLLWGGPPNRILKWARNGRVVLFACEATIDELKRIIHYKRFAQRLSVLKITLLPPFGRETGYIHLLPSVDRCRRSSLPVPHAQARSYCESALRMLSFSSVPGFEMIAVIVSPKASMLLSSTLLPLSFPHAFSGNPLLQKLGFYRLLKR